ncbi:MAG: ribonuclease HII [Litorimonas sp.]
MPKPYPDLSFEKIHDNSQKGPICGVDEAGRGPLAGPVVAAAVILDQNYIPDGLNDSKILSAMARERLLNALIPHAIIGIGISEPEEIDRINILWASMIAMRRAVENLPVKPAMALIDGNRAPKNLPCDAYTIVKGDSKSLSIAAASIVAKVTRDRLMRGANIRFTGYNLTQHQGYPTKAHKEAIERLGKSPIHRWSFKPKPI